jgi:LCP family protein required for cell wall assembly
MMTNNLTQDPFDVETEVESTQLAVDNTQPAQTEPDTIKPVIARKKRFNFGKFISLLVIIASLGGIGAIAFGSSMLNAQGSLGNGRDQKGFFSSLGEIGSILNQNSREKLNGEADGRTNFLLLGKDANDGGSSRTDTIMVASYFYETGKITTMNIPRDLLVYDGFGSYKINGMYTFAEQRNEGSGEQFLTDFLSKELDLPIHYWMSVDFNSVEQIVDTLGGIEVQVDNAFTDYQYPNKNFGYMSPAPTFKEGLQTMDGETALIYARSRKADNPEEAGDFARSRRQSIIMEAILNKLKSKGVLGNAKSIGSFYDIVDQYVRSNLKLSEIVSLGQALKDNENQEFNRLILEDGDGLMCPGTIGDFGSHFIYCDGTTPGKVGVSQTRNKIRQMLKSIDHTSSDSSILESKVVFVGNQSNETTAAYNKLSLIGFENIQSNNAFLKIPEATFTSTETVTAYIKDQEKREKFQQLLDDELIEYSVKEGLPANKPLPAGYETADIIIYVESVK